MSWLPWKERQWLLAKRSSLVSFNVCNGWNISIDEHGTMSKQDTPLKGFMCTQKYLSTSFKSGLCASLLSTDRSLPHLGMLTGIAMYRWHVSGQVCATEAELGRGLLDFPFEWGRNFDWEHKRASYWCVSKKLVLSDWVLVLGACTQIMTWRSEA